MKSRGGYTIIEVLVVLGITGLIFLGALVLINGRTSQVEFKTGIQGLTSEIQQTITEVSNGFYPSNNNFNCDGSAGSLQVTTASPNQQGTNLGCVFIGKALQFTTGSNQYTTYTVAALQQSGGQEVQGYAQAKPCVLAPGTGAGSVCNGIPAALSGTTTLLQNSIGVVSGGMFYCSSTPAATCSPSSNDGSIGAVAFLSSLSAYDGGGQLVSGAQHLNLIPITASTLNSGPAAVDKINNALEASGPGSADYFAAAATPANTVGICFVSGTTKQSGLITIGGSNTSTLAVKLTIYSTVNCS